jgi:small GTP-binding protein
MNFIPGQTGGSQIILKAVVLGGSEVGKTSLCNRYYLKKWDPVTTPTISASCLRREIELDNSNVMYCIWDTAGQERFRSISPLYYRGAHVGIIVFDRTSPPSLEAASSWIEELRTHGTSGIPLILVGNKSDLTDSITSDRAGVTQLTESTGATYFEVSALSGQNVEEMFLKAAMLGFGFYSTQNVRVEVKKVETLDETVRDVVEVADQRAACC